LTAGLCIRAIDGLEERQQVHAAEQPGQLLLEQSLQGREATASEAVDVGDQLYLVLHR